MLKVNTNFLINLKLLCDREQIVNNVFTPIKAVCKRIHDTWEYN